MKASELRLGNYINSLGQQFNDENQFKGWDNYVVKVDIDVLKNIFIENKDFKYSPIPLIEEWILKCKKTEHNAFWANLSKDSDGYFLWVSGFKIYTKYVHQLQNLYFALTGNELEIK